jgi:hypothetical protein
MRGEEMVADINAQETTDVDVEILMDLIRRRVYDLPDARYIMGEIERARLKADGIVTCRIGEEGPTADGNVQPRSRWLKFGVKARVAGLIVRAVRMHFRYQQVFNNSVIGVLQLVAQDLYAYERRLDGAGRPGEDEFASLPPASARRRRRARSPLRTRRTARGYRRRRN